MSRTRTLLTAGALSAALALPLAAIPTTASAAPQSRPASRVVGLLQDGTTLVRFALGAPQQAKRIGAVSNLQTDTRLVGIDYRVQDNKLYGVGDEGGVYRVQPRGVAVLINRLEDANGPVALEGSLFGVDFNPAADRLRIVSNTGQNLRHDVSGTATPPTVVDTPLSSPPATGTTAGVTAAGYTNNDLTEATGTTLFVVNASTDMLAVQAPANAGTLSTVGSLRVPASPNVGLDIGNGNRAFATIAAPGRYRLFEVNLTTGKATGLRYFPMGVRVADLAIPLR